MPAARQLGCAPNTIRNYMRDIPVIAETVRDERENAVDLAQTALMDAVDRGEIAAIIFTLKTLGKSRGFVEKQQIEHSGEVTSGVMIAPATVSEDEWVKLAAVTTEKQKELRKELTA